MCICDDANDVTTVEYWGLNQNRYGKKKPIYWSLKILNSLQNKVKIAADRHRIIQSYCILSWKGPTRIIESHSWVHTESRKSRPYVWDHCPNASSTLPWPLPREGWPPFGAEPFLDSQLEPPLLLAAPYCSLGSYCWSPERIGLYPLIC